MQYGIITADIQGSTELNREAFQRILKDLGTLISFTAAFILAYSTHGLLP